MATKKLKLRGYINWAKVFEQNRDMEGFEGAARETDGQTSFEFHMSPEELSKLQEAGSIKQPKVSTDHDGYYMVRFSRPWHIPGREFASGPAPVLKADGTRWDYDLDGTIGNGSVADVWFDVYDTKTRRKGTRHTKIQIVEHVPYVPEEVEEEEEPAPKPTKSKPKKAEKVDNIVEEDDIPF